MFGFILDANSTIVRIEFKQELGVGRHIIEHTFLATADKVMQDVDGNFKDANDNSKSALILGRLLFSR